MVRAEGEGYRCIYHLERSFIARSVSCELHSSISGHQSRLEGRGGTFSASSADLGSTIMIYLAGQPVTCLETSTKGRKSGGESHNGTYIHSGQSGRLLMRVKVSLILLHVSVWRVPLTVHSTSGCTFWTS